MKNIILPSLLIVLCVSCNMDSTVTERFKRVETKQLILLDQNGNSYELRVDESGNVKAIQLRDKE